MKTFQDRNELEQLRATVAKLLEEQQADLEKLARQARTITAREKSVLEIWQDFRDATDRANELQIWYTESESRHAACANAAQVLEDERDEARQLAVDFRYRFEEAQKRNESYAIQFALDNDRIAQLERRIAELEEQQRPRYSTEQIVEQKLLQRDFERAEGRA